MARRSRISPATIASIQARMTPPRIRWLSFLALGSSLVLVVCLLIMLFSYGSLRTIPGYPYTLLVVYIWVLALQVAMALVRFREASQTPPRTRRIQLLAVLVSTVGLVLWTLPLLLLPWFEATTRMWLLFIGFGLHYGGRLLEAGWGKTDVGAWLRIIIGAVIGAIVVIGMIFVWFSLAP
jgi:hypothetical protein